MNYLLAATAFAVLMIVFSTAVTGLTETYLRLFSIRSKVLANSVLQFVKQDPTIQRFMQQSVNGNSPSGLQRFLKTNFPERIISALNGDTGTRLDLAALHFAVAANERRAEAARTAWVAAENAATEAIAAQNNPDQEQLIRDAAAARTELNNAERAVEAAEQALATRRNALEEAENASMQEVSNLAETTMDSLTLNQTAQNLSLGWLHWIGKLFHNLRVYFGKRDAERVETLTTYSFLQRLAKTKVGKEIARSGEEAALRGLTMSFERFVASSNEVFRKHAQAMTMVLSVVFAFSFNIDADRLFRYLLANPNISITLVEQGEEIGQENKEATERLNKVIAELGVQSGDDSETAKALDQVKDALSEAQASTKAILDNLDKTKAELNLPIGWDQYPYNGELHLCVSFRGNCAAPFTWIDAAVFVRWLFGTILAGFLIGLGGPFWYRVFASLSSLLQTLRSFQGTPRNEAIETDKPKVQPGSQELVTAVAGGKGVKPGALMRLFRASTGEDPASFGPVFVEEPEVQSP